MASLVLATAGAAIGSGIGGSILGVSAATIGGAIGSAAGSVVDAWLVSQLTPARRVEGPRLDTLQVTTSTEGAVVPRVHGSMRVGGNIIWATDFREETRTTRQGGGKGGGGGTITTEYLYTASFAVALCEGPITGIGRIWADGKPLSLEGVTVRLHPGDETQEPDPFIAARMGAAETPAYRGVAYVVFEELPLARFGNRIPQLAFEVFRPLLDEDSLESLIRAVTIIPATGEFVYATDVVRRVGAAGETIAENVNALSDAPDFVVALDRLQAAAPNLEAVSLVVAWFGDDLRAGDCRLRPGVETREKATTPQDWSVAGFTRETAYLVSRDGNDRPAYGGTPADFAVVQAIQELKARGLRVTFYPFILMDVPPGNTLPNPYSDDAAEVGQPAHPWRGRITCSPAAGFAGSPDRTTLAGDQVAAFAAELRAFILHYAQLCADAGGVDTFLIGSELRGLTWIRGEDARYPFVDALRTLAADARAILGPDTAISYAADWSEYFGHHPQDGSGDVFFHLDPLWADPAISFVGIDNYMPLADWRDGAGHCDAEAGWPSIHDRAYPQANIAGGEGFDWYYASEEDRAQQARSPITDGLGKPWVFRPKDLCGWWSSLHVDRPGGSESAAPTAWTPGMKPIRFTELGCQAIDKGANQPNVFFDPKSAESALPHFSRGWRDDAIQRRFLEAHHLFWADPADNPASDTYGGPMVETGEIAVWTGDARPYPAFPIREDEWADANNWRLGHWLNGRLGAASLGTLVRALCRRAGMPDELIDTDALAEPVHGFLVTALESPRASIAQLARHFGFDAVETEGRIRFLPRAQAPAATLALDDLVAADAPEGETLELVRAQETELPQALKWSLLRADEEFAAMTVEAQRGTGSTARVAAERFTIATIPSEADRRCRRALVEAWVGRETATLRLPPSRLALDPGDVLALAHDGRTVLYRVTTVADAGARAIEAVRIDPAVYDLAPGPDRAAQLPGTVVHGPPAVAILDLPQLRDDVPPHQPLIAVHAQPWPGEVAVWRSPAEDGFTLITTVGRPARMGTLVDDLPSGPIARFDRVNVAVVDLWSGTLESVTDLALFGGANALAVESMPGLWEIVQFGSAELIAPGRYRLSRLLRGQRGTEHTIGDPSPAGARVVVLNDALAPLPIPAADLGLAMTWRIGPASKPVSEQTMVARAFAPSAIGLHPFSVAHVRAVLAPSGDVEIGWIRRSRALAADSWGGRDVPLAEESEAYEVDILDGTLVRRTLAATSPRATYSVAAQVADRGTPLGPGETLTVRIAQRSDAVGRGTPRTVTLTL